MITPRPGGGYEIELAGFVVNQCVVDYAFTLLLVKPFESIKGQQHVDVRIEVPFVCTVDGALRYFDPERDVVGLGQALGLVRRSVEHAWIETDGTLASLFTDAEVRVPAHPEFEAWNLAECGGVLVICLPGGDIAVFDPPETS